MEDPAASSESVGSLCSMASHYTMRRYLFTVGLCTAAIRASASTVGWGADENGFSLSSGLPLSNGSLVRLGYFTIDDQTIKENATNIAFLDSTFQEFDRAQIGQGDVDPGQFSKTSTRNPSPAGFANQQIYLWAFASGDIATASEHGIFYMPVSADTDWKFPAGALEATTIGLGDLTSTTSTLDPRAALVIGGFSNPNFTLMPIPEPSSALLLITSAASFVLRRRRA